MEQYLYDEAVWLVPTDKIRGLNGKTILIVKDEKAYHATLTVMDADPGSPNHGACCVIAKNYSHEEKDWLKSSKPPTSKSHLRQQFLGEQALNLVLPHNDDSDHPTDFLMML